MKTCSQDESSCQTDLIAALFLVLFFFCVCVCGCVGGFCLFVFVYFFGGGVIELIMNCDLRYVFEYFFHIWWFLSHRGKCGGEEVHNEYPVLQGTGFQCIDNETI